jgi:hypothetical protein
MAWIVMHHPAPSPSTDPGAFACTSAIACACPNGSRRSPGPQGDHVDNI